MTRLETLWLIRHGPIDAKPGLCIGWGDPPLANEEDAEARGERHAAMIKNAGAVYTSDLQRAVRSARPISSRLGCPLIIDKALREIHFGAWEGKTWAEVERDFPEAYRHYMENWRTAKMPGGESYTDLKQRVITFINKELLPTTHKCLVVVAHGGSLMAMMDQLMGSFSNAYPNKMLDRGEAAVLRNNCH